MVARDVTCRRVALLMFPIDRYTGHAAWSPRNCDSFVLSDARMIGAIVAPRGSLFYEMRELSYSILILDCTHLCIPPPICRIHLTVGSFLLRLVCIHSDRLIRHLLSKKRVPYQFSDAVDRISPPKVKTFSHEASVIISNISGHSDVVINPLDTGWQSINMLEECVFA